MSTDNPDTESRGPLDLPDLDGPNDTRFPDPGANDDTPIVPTDDFVDVDPHDPYASADLIPDEGYGEAAR